MATVLLREAADLALPHSLVFMLNSLAHGNGCFFTDQLEIGAAKYWELFYQRNGSRFFSDRHYLEKEAGCGVGNALLPLLETNAEAIAYACDFSPSAVDILRSHPLHQAGRVHAFVADLTADDLASNVPEASIDFCTLIFVLSAIDPSKMPQVLQNIGRTLKVGSGRVLVRDYAEGDLAQARLATKQQQLGDNFFARGDGTRAFYFSEEGLLELFRRNGYRCMDMHVHERQVENRAKAIVMERRWIQAVFLYTGIEEDVTSDLLFSEANRPEEIVETVHVEGLGCLELRSISRTHRHTLPHTGLMHWESGPALARFILAHPEVFAGSRVLEVGCGSNPLVAFAALRHCRRVIACDGSPKALALMETNVSLNASLVVVERLRLRQLRWGDAIHVNAVLQKFGHVDIAVGADVVYVEEAVPELFNSIARLLDPSREGLVFLCHVTRRVSEQRVIDLAAAVGLVPMQCAAEEFESGPIRLLSFQRPALGI
ncbi:S-adenosyl-L-methionine-dependent methyltransferase [Coccomyxa subellipsoidea C-169]|uniref:S-adenosyl-L-methionine-dependent methyltransferase n=1 Tax=Coccomyxa subellipsoidea (strain C-169) TaxID=574566 RepID=I0YVN6_COCSC|nr:S-adenosyl-L-methionine-dependent methyltransferase [Coccomyxa subellipsoidea C-169]EIE22455.1 S-adenosyl-L-methionine-dependent methyltransferase [Coccomyxa subellipsoidea C-169]|eukprot:XP_005646999.1 S-adenosyl-L-methionine-dependent methyltransferase [Coccomyxa subellipsoidea C-169]